MKQHNDVRKKIEDYSYGLVDIVSRGTLGTVYAGVHDKTNEKVAIKVIDSKTIKNLNGKYVLQNQTEALRKLSHPHIVKLMDIYSTTNNRYILTEYCEDGDLKSFLSKRKGNSLSQGEILTMFRGIYQGFKYMNNKGYIHRRINPTNILLKNGICKINNFSMVRKDPTIPKKDSIPISSQSYCSPQVLQGGVYSQKSDIWSLGVILYQLFHASLPWSNRQTQSLLSQIHSTNISYSKWVSEDAKDFMKRCLTIDENKRFSVTQMENHPFISILLGKDLYRDQCLSPLPIPKIKSEKLNIFPKQKINVNEKIINQQINFTRYLYKLYLRFPRGPLKFLLLKQLLSNLEALKAIANKRNVFEIDNFEEFMLKERTKKMIDVIEKYNIKYSKLYDEFKNMIAKGPEYPSYKHHFNSQLDRSEGLPISIVQHCLRDIKQFHKKLKQYNLSSVDDNEVLPDQPQETALLLDLTITYYQLNCLLLDNWLNLEVFANAAQLDILSATDPSMIQKRHIKPIEDKLRDLGII